MVSNTPSGKNSLIIYPYDDTHKQQECHYFKIQNDIAFSVDSGKAVALTLLDLSAAFDMIDHSLLYDCLHDWFGLDGTVLLWNKSYLSNRKQKIKIGDSFSESVILPFGVPQGSVLGPLLFTPQLLMAVWVLFSPMVSGWSGGRTSGRTGARAGARSARNSLSGLYLGNCKV